MATHDDAIRNASQLSNSAVRLTRMATTFQAQFFNSQTNHPRWVRNDARGSFSSCLTPRRSLLIRQFSDIGFSHGTLATISRFLPNTVVASQPFSTEVRDALGGHHLFRALYSVLGSVFSFVLCALLCALRSARLCSALCDLLRALHCAPTRPSLQLNHDFVWAVLLRSRSGGSLVLQHPFRHIPVVTGRPADSPQVYLDRPQVAQIWPHHFQCT
jgi:hypothetical protein